MRRNSTQYVYLGALTTAAMVCGFAEGHPKAPDPEPETLVYLKKDLAPDHVVVARAKEVASSMFAVVGVRLAWAKEGADRLMENTVAVHPRASFKGAAVRNAHPYAGGKEAFVIKWGRLRTKTQMSTGLTVLVHDYTGLPPTALQEVESETTLLLLRTGIRVEWILCRAAWLSDMPEACLARLTADRFVMRIVEHHIGTQVKRGDPLGSAEIDNQYATLYSAEIRSSAAKHGVGFGSLMAYAATHEIGHLLLGPQHGSAGMMQAVWGKTEYRDMAQRWLGFEAAEREAMQGRVRERVQAAFGER